MRVILALCCLLPAYWLLKLAYWICPALKDTKEDTSLCWMDAAKGWEEKVN